MNNTILVSIIIPVYNTEKYLPFCINSVLNQTYKNIEIIIVDDGSTDSSTDICNAFEKKDSRIRVLHKVNGGLSDARNVGTDNSTGEYIVYLDSDDYISEDYIEKSLEMCLNYSAEISIMQMCYVAESTNEILVNQSENELLIFDAKEAIKESLYQKRFSCCAPSKMYKREILKNIRFPVGRLSEDLAVSHKILGSATQIVYSSDYGYYYRQHDKSIMHTFNPRRLDALEWCDDIETYCAKNYPDIISAAKCRTFNVAVHLLLDLPINSENRDTLYNKIFAEIKRTRNTVLLDKEVRFREKAAAILSFFGEKILKKVWNSKIAVKQSGY